MNGDSMRRHIDRLCLLLLCALAGATAAAQFARLGWLPELASHFRPQYLFVALALLPALALMRRRSFALVACAVAVANAWYVGPYLLPTLVPASVAHDARPGVSLISLNLYLRNHEHERVREYLQRSRPDVLVLTELTPAWVAALRDVTSRYPFWMSLDRRSPWGLGVYSKYPLTGTELTTLGVHGSVNVVTTVAAPGGDVQLVAVHLSSPTSPERAERRNGQLGRLTELLNALPPPAGGKRRRVLVGDLNITPYSPYLQDLLVGTGMRDARRDHGLLGTWPTWMPPLQVHIDHCITDPGLAVTRIARGPAVGSDHYPLEITLH